MDENYNVKVADFGLARFKTTKNESSLAKLRGNYSSEQTYAVHEHVELTCFSVSRYVHLCGPGGVQRGGLHHQIGRVQLWSYLMGNCHASVDWYAGPKRIIPPLLTLFQGLTFVPFRNIRTSSSTFKSLLRRPRRASGEPPLSADTPTKRANFSFSGTRL